MSAIYYCALIGYHDIAMEGVCTNHSDLTITLCSQHLQQIRIDTQEDDELVLLKHTITQRWPNTIKEVPNVSQFYWTFKEELTIEDGIILKGTRIAIPAKKWKAVLKLIHEGHLGLNKCKLHAKETLLTRT